MPARVVPLVAVPICLIVARIVPSPGVRFVRAPTPGGAPGRQAGGSVDVGRGAPGDAD